ncbi:MAG: conserved rane protein of unknown function [Deltaproteobacteria bacterium]|nr:conserved rane protein of unknown function [Deltaproteobacteria bacterium]
MILKLILIILTSLLGYFLGDNLFITQIASLIGLGSGAILGLAIIMLGRKIEKMTTWVILGGVFGLVVGLFIANLFTHIFLSHSTQPPEAVVEMSLLINASHLKENYKILDTSVIIDGRIFDICETGFIEGTLVIPQFVLQELMRIADSSDPLRKTRGRRGLDILKKIQKQTDLDVIISDQDFSKIKEVDHKLVALAQKMGGIIVTNDVNLNEIAEIQGITVFNINQLASALRPIVLPGEIINVYVQKEGKEYGQGIAYLDDGTMVVVKDGKKIIGRNAEVAVTSVLQTTAGRMIFAEAKENSHSQNVHRLK